MMRPAHVKKLYQLGFKAGVQVDVTAYAAFWWELSSIDPLAAERLNMDVRNEIYDRVTL